MSENTPDSHAAIVRLLTRDALCEEFDLKPHQPRDWELRDSIPPERWLDVAALAKRCGHKQITADLIKELYDPKRGAKSSAQPNKGRAVA